MRSLLGSAVVAVAVTSAVLTATPAAAAAPVQATGTCSAGSVWRLTADADGELIDITYGVRSGVPRQLWSFIVDSDDGALTASGRKPTNANGAFSVFLIAPDLDGQDIVVAKARNARTGETCEGQLIVP